MSRKQRSNVSVNHIIIIPDDGHVRPKYVVNKPQKVVAVETEVLVLDENLSECHFPHYKSHMTRPGIEARWPRLEASD
jgi:hypothetical protein